jgi:hypothetical protein
MVCASRIQTLRPDERLIVSPRRFGAQGGRLPPVETFQREDLKTKMSEMAALLFTVRQKMFSPLFAVSCEDF